MGTAPHPKQKGTIVEKETQATKGTGALSPAQTLGWKLTSPPKPMPRKRRIQGGGGRFESSWLEV